MAPHLNIPRFNCRLRRIFLAAISCAGLCVVSPAFANSYIVDLNSKKVTDLGSDVVANAINDAGQVVGQRSGHAFITGPDDAGMRDIGTLGGAQSWASGVNAAGQVVGWSDTSSGARHAFITGPDGVGMKDLGIGPNSVSAVETSSSALAVNNLGQVVGWSQGFIPYEYTPRPGNYYKHAFITGPNGTDMRYIDVGYSGVRARASGINAAGQVAGDRYYDPFSDVFITGQNGTGLTKIDGLGGPFDYASGINDTGQVIGRSRTAFSPETGDADHAFVTGADGIGTRDLGTLGGQYSEASGINDAGRVVGSSEITPGDWGHRHAFVADPNSMGMADLNLLVNAPAGVTFTGASAINNVGQVVAAGLAAVIPEPETYAMLLAGLGLLGFIVRRRKTA